MFKNYFYAKFRELNPKNHYNAVLSALDDLCAEFNSALEFEQFLREQLKKIQNEKKTGKK